MFANRMWTRVSSGKVIKTYVEKSSPAEQHINILKYAWISKIRRETTRWPWRFAP